MTFHKPMILYYDNGNSEKRNVIECSLKPLGISLVTVLPEQFSQTVGYLAKIKGFPPRKVSFLEAPSEITEEIMVMCNFTEETLDLLLGAMKQGLVPRVSLKAMLTTQNSFWTFSQLFQELLDEHRHFHESK